MKRPVLLDTGPLVALLNHRDVFHAWAAAQWELVTPPLLSCEAVLSEACFLLRGAPGGCGAVMELVRRKIVVVGFRLEDHVAPVVKLLGKYAPKISELALVPSSGGAFEVSVNGTTIFSKLQTGSFPSESALVDEMASKL